MKKIFLLLIVAVACYAMADDVTLHKPLQLGPKNRNQIVMQGFEVSDTMSLDGLVIFTHLEYDSNARYRLHMNTAGTVVVDTSNAVYNCTDVFTCIDTDAVIATQSFANSNYWNIHGNSGTNPATDFFGTTNGQQLSIYSWHNGNYNNNAGLVLYGDYSVSPTSFNLSCPDSGRNTNHQILGSGDNIAITSSNFLQDSLSYIDIHRDSIYAVFYAGAISQPFTIYPNAVKIVDGTQGAGKVLTSDANGLASWQPTSFTASDSATIYALTPANGTTYFCSDCSGDGVTGRIVSYFGSLWRRLKFD